MRKKIILSILVALCLMFFSGCGSVSYYNIIGSDGSITRDLVIEFDQDYAYKEQAYFYAKATMEENVELNEYLSFIFDEENYSLTLREYYPTMTDYYIANNITGDEVEENDLTREIDWFYVRYTREADIIFNNYTNEINNYLNHFSIYANAPIYIDPIEFKYIYGTQYKAVESNAEEVNIVDGLYYNQWTANLNNLHNSKIITTSVNPFTPLWYGIAIVGAIVSAGCAAIIKKLFFKV